jgi:hypothetical protein
MGRTVREVSREAGLTHHGVVQTGRLEHDLLSRVAAAADAAPARGPALAEVVLARSAGVLLPGRVPVAGVEMGVS